MDTGWLTGFDLLSETRHYADAADKLCTPSPPCICATCMRAAGWVR